MTKSLFMEKLSSDCKHQVPGHFLVETQNGDTTHTKPLEGSGGLEMELKDELFKFSSVVATLIRPY